MSIAKTVRPAFQPVELDPIDAKLEARAAEKGIPTLVATSAPKAVLASDPKLPELDIPKTAAPRRANGAVSKEATPRERMRGIRVDLPDYAWVALKKRTAEDMVSLRFFIMDALRAKGIHIDDADMVEDGRRLRD
jgi:hypothetical protein